MEAVPRWKGQMLDVEVVSHLATHGLKLALRDISHKGFYNAIFMRQTS
jgi:hypothetical protein